MSRSLLRRRIPNRGGSRYNRQQARLGVEALEERIALNQAPVAQDSLHTVERNGSLSAYVLATDADSDPLTFVQLSAPNRGSLAFDPATGAFTYTPNPGYVGPDGFTFQAFDGIEFSNLATVSFNVVCTGGCIYVYIDGAGVVYALGDSTDNQLTVGFEPDTVVVDGIAFPRSAVTGVRVDLAGGNNALQVPTVDSQSWVFTDSNRGSVLVGGFIKVARVTRDSGPIRVGGFNPVISFESVQNLVGGNGPDTFVFNDGANISGTLDGAGGTNTLDYSAYTTPVTVNLLLDAATGTASVFNIHNVRGGQRNDILVGNAANNLLRGGLGRDLLIGGPGSDTLLGEEDEDIVIGGPTAHDANVAVLMAIREMWSGPNPYEQRVNALAEFLNVMTVFGDGAADMLMGGADLDWFFADAQDTTDHDAPSGEQLVPV